MVMRAGAPCRGSTFLVKEPTVWVEGVLVRVSKTSTPRVERVAAEGRGINRACRDFNV
jgi:hypothetical protein